MKNMVEQILPKIAESAERSIIKKGIINNENKDENSKKMKKLSKFN